MTEILPGVHQVEGLDPSPDFTTHVYLIKDKGPTWTLIDTGLPGSDVAIGKYLAKIKVEPTAIKRIVLTHLHRDHTGGLRKMVEMTHARTFSHWIEAAYIAGNPKYDGPGVPPLEDVTVDETLKDGDHIDAGGGLTLYHTPGHTPGHVSLYQTERKLLFSGDLFFGTPTGLVLTVPDFTHDTPTAQISARRIGQLSVDSVLSYHGGPVLRGGGKAIRDAIAAFS
jgi:glyoxylase-like metal-dependent hydrolase (beta-lactamase superfamily II)